MGRTHKEVMASLPEEHRKKIEARSKELMQSLDNEMIANLIAAINQDDDLQLRDEAYRLIMEQVDELMEKNGGEGPDAKTKDGKLLKLLAETIEGYEGQINF